MEIKFHGQSCFELSEGETTVLVDPFLKPNNPAAVATAEEVEPTHIALSHGHADHMADAVARRQADRRPLRRDRRARQLARSAGRREASATPTSAARSSSTGAGSSWCRPGTRARSPGSDEAPFSAEHGIVDRHGGGPADPRSAASTVYHAGDTCLFGDMKLIAERNPVDVALLPIGGHYTMDRHDAVVAAEFIGAGDGDPDALRHLPADRDRQRRLQVRGRVEDLLAGGPAEAGGDAHGWLNWLTGQFLASLGRTAAAEPRRDRWRPKRQPEPSRGPSGPTSRRPPIRR